RRGAGNGASARGSTPALPTRSRSSRWARYTPAVTATSPVQRQCFSGLPSASARISPRQILRSRNTPRSERPRRSRRRAALALGDDARPPLRHEALPPPPRGPRPDAPPGQATLSRQHGLGERAVLVVGDEALLAIGIRAVPLRRFARHVRHDDGERVIRLVF